MKMLTTKLVLIAALVAVSAAAQPAVRRYQYPRQRSQSAYGVWVKSYRHGQPTYRFTYPGYINNFPPPANLYYGYPQSGHSYGIGF